MNSIDRRQCKYDQFTDFASIYIFSFHLEDIKNIISVFIWRIKKNIIWNHHVLILKSQWWRTTSLCRPISMTKINLFLKFIYLSCFFASFMLKRLIAKLPPPPNPIGSGCHIRRQERSICSDTSAAAAAGEEFYRSHLCHDLHLHHLHLQPSSCALIEVLVVRERHFKGGPSFLWSSSSSPLTIFICVGWSAGEERAFPFFLKMPFLPSSSQISQ